MSAVGSWFALTALLYAASSCFYLAMLLRGAAVVGRYSRGVLAFAAASHAAFLLQSGGPWGTIHSALSLLSLGVALAFVVFARRPSVEMLGAFLTPLILVFFLGSGLQQGVGQVSDEVRSVLLPVHITVNVLGFVAFALAFGAALGYVLQERLLRRRRLTGVFERLPSLDALDALGLRAVVIGFPLLTLGIVTGAFWAARLRPGVPLISPAQAFAVISWVLFAVVLLTRVSVGWRGRRAAIGTIMGFVCALAVLVGYMVRA